MINLASIVLSPALNTSTFTVTRDPGSSQGGGYFARGGFVDAPVSSSPSASLTATGIITPAEAKALMLLPEGDRIASVISILTTTQLQVSAEGPPAHEADIVAWNGQQYKVTKLLQWGAYGYCEALATQITTA